MFKGHYHKNLNVSWNLLLETPRFQVGVHSCLFGVGCACGEVLK